MNIRVMSLRSAITLLGVLLSLISGIWVGWKAYLVPGAFPPYVGDWRWFALYGGLLLFAAVLAWFHKSKLLLALTAAAALSLIGSTIVLADLVPQFLFFLWFLITALAIGDWLLESLTRGMAKSGIDRIVLGLPLGFGFWMVVGLLLGAAGAYSREGLVGLLAVFSVMTIPRWIRAIIQGMRTHRLKTLDRLRSSDLRAFALALFVFILFCIGPYLWSSAPTIRWDALSYHVSVPAIYIDQGGMVEVPESVQSYFVHYAEMLFTLGLLLAGQPLPGWLHFSAGLASALSAGFLGAKIANPRVGILAALLVITLPLVNFEVGTAYMDGFTMLFITAMVYAGLLWWEHNAKSWLVISGIGAGMAVGFKLNALPFVGAFFVLFLIILLKRSRSIRVILDAVVSFTAPAALLWSPWLLREALWTGNPIYPYYDWFFRGSGANAGNTSTWSIGVGSPSLRSPAILWDMVVNSSRYYHESPGGAILALPWLALPWAYIWPGLIDREVRKKMTILLIYTFVAVILLFTISVHLRYLMPIYPMMSILAAANLDASWKVSQALRPRKIITAVAFVLVFSLLLASQAASIIRMPGLAERYPYRLAFRVEDREEFLDRTLPFYKAFRYLDQQPGRPRVFALGVDFRLYTRAQIDDPLFDSVNIVKASRTPDELAQALTEGGYEYILLYPVEMRARPQFYSSSALTSDFFSTYTRLAFTNGRVYLFEIYPVSRSDRNKNLLANGDFEESNQSGLVAWNTDGIQSIHSDGAFSKAGNSVLLLSGSQSPGGSSLLSQVLPVHAGEVYDLSTWARADGDASFALLTISWFGNGGQVVSRVQEGFSLHAQWENIWLFALAPQDALRAEIMVAAVENTNSWFDDATFSEHPIGGNR